MNISILHHDISANFTTLALEFLYSTITTSSVFFPISSSGIGKVSVPEQHARCVMRRVQL